MFYCNFALWHSTQRVHLQALGRTGTPIPEAQLRWRNKMASIRGQSSEALRAQSDGSVRSVRSVLSVPLLSHAKQGPSGYWGPSWSLGPRSKYGWKDIRGLPCS